MLDINKQRIQESLSLFRQGALLFEQLIDESPEALAFIKPGEATQLPIWIINLLLDEGILLSIKDAQNHAGFVSYQTLYTAMKSNIYPLKHVRIGVRKTASSKNSKAEGRYYFTKAWLDDYIKNKPRRGRPPVVKTRSD